LLPFADKYDRARIHVQEPIEVILLCGGKCSNIADPVSLSLRDAFIKIIDNPPLRDRDIIQAEDVTEQVEFFRYYDNILDFEAHLAQIVELIIIFCESEGSLAELGAFAMVEEILARLFVVVRERHWAGTSFIKLGPLRLIEKRVGRDAIQVIADVDVGISEHSTANADKVRLRELLSAPLTLRLSKKREPTTFSSDRPGHVIKLAVGLVQEYGALTADEISHAMGIIGVNCDDRTLSGYLLCAKSVGWLKVVSKGSNDYFIAPKGARDAATLHLRVDDQMKDKLRRRALIRVHWKETDQLRHSAITQELG
jgi:hypothetical protein